MLCLKHGIHMTHPQHIFYRLDQIKEQYERINMVLIGQTECHLPCGVGGRRG